MCNLSQQHLLARMQSPVESLPMISDRNLSLTSAQLSLKKKNDARAFALLKALSQYQTAPSANLTEYPHLQALLEKRKQK
jgi:hypothetical protein